VRDAEIGEVKDSENVGNVGSRYGAFFRWHIVPGGKPDKQRRVAPYAMWSLRALSGYVSAYQLLDRTCGDSGPPVAGPGPQAIKIRVIGSSLWWLGGVPPITPLTPHPNLPAQLTKG
jgi:hypothetical protein